MLSRQLQMLIFTHSQRDLILKYVAVFKRFNEKSVDLNQRSFMFKDDFLIVAFPFADKMTDKIVNGEKGFYESLLLNFAGGEWF